jgi:hypothetical protein
VTTIRKAICLPADLSRELAHVAANKNFAYGGLYDKTSKIFVVDKKDLSTALTMADHIVYKTKKYDFVTIDETEDGSSYLIKTKNIDASPIILDP